MHLSASSDLNLTFVVDEDQADRVVRRLHAQLFAGAAGDPEFGAPWNETFGTAEAIAEASPPW